MCIRRRSRTFAVWSNCRRLGWKATAPPVKCDVFLFTDFVLFLRAKSGTAAKVEKKHHRYHSGEQTFLLLREDVGRVEEKGDHRSIEQRVMAYTPRVHFDVARDTRCCLVKKTR